MTRDLFTRWLGPVLLLLVVLVGYSWFVAPVLADWRDDWSFLHLARVQAIVQMQQAQQRAAQKPSAP